MQHDRETLIQTIKAGDAACRSYLLDMLVQMIEDRAAPIIINTDKFKQFEVPVKIEKPWQNISADTFIGGVITEQPDKNIAAEIVKKSADPNVHIFTKGPSKGKIVNIADLRMAWTDGVNNKELMVKFDLTHSNLMQLVSKYKLRRRYTWQPSAEAENVAPTKRSARSKSSWGHAGGYEPPPTFSYGDLEPVVLFLRQRDCVVTMEGSKYRVDNRFYDREGIIKLANAKRTAMGKEPFVL